MRKVWLMGALSISLWGFADENDEIAFDEEAAIIHDTECYEEHCHHRRLRPHRYNPEEDRVYEERTEASWPSKREDTLLEQLTR